MVLSFYLKSSGGKNSNNKIQIRAGLPVRRPQKIKVEKNPFDPIYKESPISRSAHDITEFTSKFLKLRFCFIKSTELNHTFLSNL